MGNVNDVAVDEDEWEELHNELFVIRFDAWMLNSFMAKHVNKKWEV